MMAMTPQEKKQLDEIERAFLEVVEPLPAKMKPSTQPSRTRRGWLGELKERLVMKFVCCAPPQTLLDDDEILEILAKAEEPVKPTKPQPPVPRAPSLKRRNSASIVPFSSQIAAADGALEAMEVQQSTGAKNEPVVEPIPKPAEVEETKEVGLASELISPPRLRFVSLQLAIVSLLKLHDDIRSRHTERAALAIQNRWRSRKLTAEVPIGTPTEPDHEPEANDHNQVAIVPSLVIDDQDAIVPSPVTVVRRSRKIRSPTTKLIKRNPVAQEVRHAIESITQLAMTRKRLRSVDVESSLTPLVDVERDVHVLFGEEEIDNDDDEDEDLIGELLLAPVSPLRAPHPIFALVPRCISVPPPSTALRPQPKKSKTLLDFKAATTIQSAWRRFKLNQEREIQRRVQQYEEQSQSVMPTIRSKMADLRKRLEELQAQTAIPMEPCRSPTLSDDDFDWL